MRLLTTLLMLTGAALILPSCHKAKQPADNQQMTIDDNVAMGGLPPGAQFETLPPDESSVTSNGELVKGDDNPDVNDLGNGN